MRFPLIATLAIAWLIAPQTLLAQGRSRGGFGGGGEGGRRFDPTEMLRGMDTNKNGSIEPSEMQANRSAFFVRGAAQRAGLDLTKPLAIDKLSAAMQAPRDGGDRSRGGDRESGDRQREDRGREERDGDRRSDRDRSGGPQPGGVRPAVPPAGSPGVVGFGAPAGGGAATFGGGALEQKFDSRVITYVDSMLERYDKNKDGYLDSEEWKVNRWSTPPEESDLNKDNRLSKEELCVRIAKRYSGSPASSTSASPAGSASSAGGDSTNSGGQVRRYAESLLKQYDKNADGKLEREEWSAMQSQHHSADTNSDGTITVEELEAKLASYAGGSSTSGSSSARLGTTQGAATGTVRRFLTQAERLPAGLPSWFLERDADQDGQVKMAEYATSWTEATAEEFASYDLNGDGIITAKECLRGGAR